MKPATVNEIKAELSTLTQKQLLLICNRLARFKKENKELLTYLLFEAGDENAFKAGVKSEMDELFNAIPKGNSPYLIKKSLRKILRITNKYIRYTSHKETEAELLMHFCARLHNSAVPISKSAALTNLYATQIKKVKKLISALHEDLQYDYLKELEEIG